MNTIGLQPVPSVALASLLLSGAVFMTLHSVVRAIVADEPHPSTLHHRDRARWARLHQASGLFRALRQWIIGISQVLERHARWIVSPPTLRGRWSHMLVCGLRLLLGDAHALARAVRIGNAVAPWTVAELAATGIIFAMFAVVATGLILGAETLTAAGLVKAALAGLAVYRGWWLSIVIASRKRQRIVKRFLPHAMDTIAMVMAAGGTFRAGMETLIRDFPHHPLSVELQRLNSELNRGQTMAQAVQVTRDSICLPEFDELVRVLNAIHQHGAPAADSIMGLAKQLRNAQLRDLEDEVGRAEALMALPTMLVVASCMVIASAPFLLAVMSSEVLGF